MTTTAGIEYKEIELSHGVTRYLEAGSGPAVVLLHGAGFTSGGDSWLANLPGLATGLHLFAPDCLGWGPGGQLDVAYSFGYIVDSVRELQDALGLERTHVVGHSMGGWLASLLAYESPNRVERLVLVASGGMATRPLGTMQAWQPPGEDAIRASFAGLAAAGVDIEPLVEERLALAADSGRADRFRLVMDHMTNPETRQRYHTRRRLPHIASPTLVLWGSNDQVNDISMGRDTHELIRGSRLEVFEGAGHGLPTERVEDFNRLVLGFLAP